MRMNDFCVQVKNERWYKERERENKNKREREAQIKINLFSIIYKDSYILKMNKIEWISLSISNPFPFPPS